MLAIYEFSIEQVKLAMFFLMISFLMARLNAWFMRLMQYFLAFVAVFISGGILNPFFVADVQQRLNSSFWMSISIAIVSVISLEAIIFGLIFLIAKSKKIFNKRYI